MQKGFRGGMKKVSGGSSFQLLVRFDILFFAFKKTGNFLLETGNFFPPETSPVSKRAIRVYDLSIEDSHDDASFVDLHRINPEEVL